MKILYKYPTRDRQLKFQRCLDRYYDYISDIDNSQFVISVDNDDSSMNCDEARKYMDSKKNLKYFYGDNTSKIMAINANIPKNDWDIVVLVSDDMIPEVRGFDQIIRERTNVPVNVSEDPLLSVVRGTGMVLENLKKYEAVLL